MQAEMKSSLLAPDADLNGESNVHAIDAQIVAG